MNEIVIEDKVAGVLYASALGDAMGMPSEQWPRARVIEHFGKITEFLPGPDGHFIVDGFAAGQITDDSEQTLLLAESIIEAGGAVDPVIISRRLVEWADRIGASEGNYLGPSSAKAIDALRNGAAPDQTGALGETNGAAMRISPVGIVSSPRHLTELVDAVEASAIMSHHTDVALSGASLVAGAVAAGIDHAPGEDAADAILEVAYEAASIGGQRGHRVIAASMIERSRLAAHLARDIEDDDDFLQQVYDVIGSSVATSETVPAAVGLFVRAQGDPVRCALLAANLGGDTDTIGAIAGAMTGAWGGLSSIPEAYVAQLDRVNGLPWKSVAAQLAALRAQRHAAATGAMEDS